MTRQVLTRTTLLLSPLLLALLPLPAMAHCDSMDGPVVQDAQRALADQDVTPVLKWVRAEDEEPIRSAFEMTLAVRGESDVAQTVADQYFFETLVRVPVPARAKALQESSRPAASILRSPQRTSLWRMAMSLRSPMR